MDFHTGRLLKGLALSNLLGVSSELTLGDEESDLVEAIRESTPDNVSGVGQRITERNLNLQQTITIRPGWPLRIIVNKDMVSPPTATGASSNDPETQPAARPRNRQDQLRCLG